jgi:hypothetical protein
VSANYARRVNPRRVRAPGRALVAGAVLIALGALLWVLSRVAATGEAHAFAPGHAPPRQVQLVQNHTYRLAIPGGLPAERRVGVTPSALACQAQRAGEDRVALRLTDESTSTKAVDTIASFIAPYGGAAHLTCTGLRRVYVEGVGSDPAGLLLVLATIALAVGVPLLLSGLRARSSHVERVDPAAEGAFEFSRHRKADVVGARPGDDLQAERQSGVADAERDLGGR